MHVYTNQREHIRRWRNIPRYIKYWSIWSKWRFKSIGRRKAAYSIKTTWCPSGKNKVVPLPHIIISRWVKYLNTKPSTLQGPGNETVLLHTLGGGEGRGQDTPEAKSCKRGLRNWDIKQEMSAQDETAMGAPGQLPGGACDFVLGRELKKYNPEKERRGKGKGTWTETTIKSKTNRKKTL